MKASHAFVLAGALALICAACGTDHADLPTAFEYNPLPSPMNLVAAPRVERCSISWSFPGESRPLVKEFRVYEYLEAYDMIQLVGVTTDTVYVDSLLIGNLRYCYKVSAVDTTGFEGYRSPAVCAFIPTRG